MSGAGRVLACAVLAAAALLSGCSGKPPEMTRFTAQLMLTQAPDSESTVERLSVFLVANDPDGFEDLSALYVIHDGAELYWKIESADWIKTTFEAETWIGSNGIGMADGSPMPRGEYRILLQDKGGDDVEDVFSLEERQPAEKTAFPKAAEANALISCSGLKETPELWIYDLADRFVTALDVEHAPVAIDAVVKQNPGLKQGFRYRLYTWDRENAVGLLAGPYAQGALKAP